MRRPILALAPVLALTCALVLGIVSPLAAGHGSGGVLPGDTLARARELGAPPARVFDDLEAGAPHYYRAEATHGSALRVVAPRDQRPAGDVLVYVFGADLPRETVVPEGIERPEGWGALVFFAADDAQHLDARFPARFDLLLARDVGAGERVVVLMSDAGGAVGVLVEPPGIAWQDLATLPSLRAEVRAWSGAPAWLGYLVGAAGGLAALAPFARRRGVPWPLLSLLGAFAAATLGASTALLAADAVRAQHAPWLLLALGLVLTGASVWASLPRGARPTWAARGVLLACGIVGVLAWSGFLWGPVAALAGALLPEPDKGA